MNATAAIILAAGKSTRMLSDLPKVLHEVCGRPMLAYVIDACREAGIGKILVVVGYRQETVRQVMVDQPNVAWVEQPEQLGTGHAVRCCEQALAGFEGDVAVIAGDMPLVPARVLTLLFEKLREDALAAVIATTVLPDPAGYGRIIRNESGEFMSIVEHDDCTDAHLAVREVNPSYYCFEKKALFDALREVRPDNSKGEYYLTEVLGILLSHGRKTAAINIVKAADAMGINSRRDLAAVNRLMQDRIQDKLMKSGVTIIDPATTWIDSRAVIGRDSIIYPFSYIQGAVTVGGNCRIGPFASLGAGRHVPDGESVGGLEHVLPRTGRSQA